MSISLWTFLTILGMMCVTYLTRVTGYFALRNRTLSVRAQSVLEAMPGAVLISVIAPAFTSDRPADLIALAVTIAVATRGSFLVTVIVAVTAAGVLRHLI
ncbi:MAG: AzlD family protein [Gammaproteobacteria bacterium]|nr:AzlD family protein [Gammaproteobacteria bacterium]